MPYGSSEMAAAAWIGAVALTVTTLACAEASERDLEREWSGDAASTTAQSATTTLPPDSISTTLDPVNQLVFDACMEPIRTVEAGLQLEAALVYESVDDEQARSGRSMDHAVMLAEQAADFDPRLSAFAEAEAYWRDHGLVTPATMDDDPQLLAAVATVDDVCATVGVPTGDPVQVPDAIYADTSERGRYNACTELIFGDDGSVYVDGERFDYSDCDRITNPALEELSHDDAHQRSVELFFDHVGGPICWGEECRDSFDF
jgi:hypothetical protein